MKAENFAKILNADFYTGVPDSQLKALCNYLMHTYGIDPKHHVIAANEGNCTALAAGYHLATGKVDDIAFSAVLHVYYRQSPGSIHAEQRRRQYHQPRGIPAER